MSTHFTTIESRFSLIAGKEQEAVEGICRNFRKNNIPASGNTFEDVMESLGWQYDNEFKELRVEGLKKLDFEDDLFDLIAEFVESGSYIDCRQDDDHIWRYFFYDGKCIELSGEINFGGCGLEIERMLTVSSAHVTSETGEWLTEQSSVFTVGTELVVFRKNAYGWFVYVPEDAEEDHGNVPEDLQALLSFSKHMDCRLLCVDRDGPVFKELKEYEW